MKRICMVSGMLIAIGLLAAACSTAPPAARDDSEWGTPTGDKSAEWALRCDVCGNVFAHNTYRTRVSLNKHRKWADGEGHPSVVVKDKTYDVCTPACRQKLLSTEGQ